MVDPVGELVGSNAGVGVDGGRVDGFAGGELEAGKIGAGDTGDPLTGAKVTGTGADVDVDVTGTGAEDGRVGAGAVGPRVGLGGDVAQSPLLQIGGPFVFPFEALASTGRRGDRGGLGRVVNGAGNKVGAAVVVVGGLEEEAIDGSSASQPSSWLSSMMLP